MTPAAKKVLEEAVKPMRRKTQVTAEQVLAQILTLQPPDPAAVLLGSLGVEHVKGAAPNGCAHARGLSPATFTPCSEGARIGRS